MLPAIAALRDTSANGPSAWFVRHVQSGFMAGKDAGVEALCPGCGRQVLQKEMIPVLAEGGGVAYLCRDCARRHIDFGSAVTSKNGDAVKADEAVEHLPGDGPGAARAKTRPRRPPRPNRPLRARAPRTAGA
jgi:hypothetical protein